MWEEVPIPWSKDKWQARWHSWQGSKHGLGLLVRQARMSCLCVPRWRDGNTPEASGGGAFLKPEAHEKHMCVFTKVRWKGSSLTKRRRPLCCLSCSRSYYEAERRTPLLHSQSREQSLGSRWHKQPPSHTLWSFECWGEMGERNKRTDTSFRSCR